MNQLILPRNQVRRTIDAIEMAGATKRSYTKVPVSFWVLRVRRDARMERVRSGWAVYVIYGPGPRAFASAHQGRGSVIAR